MAAETLIPFRRIGILSVIRKFQAILPRFEVQWPCLMRQVLTLEFADARTQVSGIGDPTRQPEGSLGLPPCLPLLDSRIDHSCRSNNSVLPVPCCDRTKVTL